MPGAQMCPRQGATVSVLLYVRLVHVPCTCTWLSISVSCERVSLRLCPCVVLLVPGAYLVNSANNKQAPTREVPGPDPEGLCPWEVPIPWVHCSTNWRGQGPAGVIRIAGETGEKGGKGSLCALPQRGTLAWESGRSFWL